MKVIAVKDYIGSTSAFYGVEGGLILKSIHSNLVGKEGFKLRVEMKILERLGEHPRIVQGFQDDPEIKGLLLLEASHGNLQNYIDRNHDTVPMATRLEWCQQVTEAIQYIHSKGVLHSDLRPENCLLHQSFSSIDIRLCDFGGSMCRDLDIDGKGLPDIPFWDLKWETTIGTDIFSLGSMFYTIMTGHWPYKLTKSTRENGDEEETKWEFEERVIAMLEKGLYPDVGEVVGGAIIMRCWKNQFLRVDDILDAQNSAWLRAPLHQRSRYSLGGVTLK